MPRHAHLGTDASTEKLDKSFHKTSCRTITGIVDMASVFKVKRWLICDNYGNSFICAYLLSPVFVSQTDTCELLYKKVFLVST